VTAAYSASASARSFGPERTARTPVFFASAVIGSLLTFAPAAAQIALAPTPANQAAKAVTKPSAATVTSLPKVADAIGDVIFVNGLKGKGRDSFTYVSSTGERIDFAALMRQDTSAAEGLPPLSRYNVHYLELDTNAHPTIEKLTDDAERALEASGIMSCNGPVNLVAHSAGGLVSIGLNRRLRVKYEARMTGLFMIGTPVSGAWRMGGVKGFLSKKAGEYAFGQMWNSLKDLDQNDWLQNHLRDLNEQKASPANRLFIGCAYEDQVTHFTVPRLPVSIHMHVVPVERMAEACEGPVRLSHDHYNIAKPESAESKVFRTVRSWIGMSYKRWKAPAVAARPAGPAVAGTVTTGQHKPTSAERPKAAPKSVK
jgi:hypothetical protein